MSEYTAHMLHDTIGLALVPSVASFLGNSMSPFASVSDIDIKSEPFLEGAVILTSGGVIFVADSIALWKASFAVREL